MKWTEYDKTNTIKNVLIHYDDLDTTNSTIRSRRMEEVKAYAKDLFKAGYNTNEVHHYVNQVTSPHRFGVARDAIHRWRSDSDGGGYFQ